MVEQEKGRICPHTHEWCPDCTYTCRIQGLISWAQDLSKGNDSFKYEPSDKQVNDFLEGLNTPSPDPKDDKNLDPFKEKFGDFFKP